MAEEVISSLMNISSLRLQLGYPPLGGAEASAVEGLYKKSVALILATLGVEAPEAFTDELTAVAHDLVLNYKEKVPYQCSP